MPKEQEFIHLLGMQISYFVNNTSGVGFSPEEINEKN